MSDQSRALPDRPSLRFLKLEAKERLAAGEFDTLHNAQLAIAREHGMSSWTLLKQTVAGQPGSDAYALAQVRWVAGRFGGADAPGWEPPGEPEIREHFADQFLTVLPPWRLVAQLGALARRLREDLVVDDWDPLTVRARAGDLQIEASAEDGPAHRLAVLRAYPVGSLVGDQRVARPAAGHAEGDVPPAMARFTAEALAEVGLPGLVLAGGMGEAAWLGGAREAAWLGGAREAAWLGGAREAAWLGGARKAARVGGARKAAGAGGTREAGWAVARGWADLDRSEELRPDHRFPALGVTKLITAVAALRLVADGRLELDAPANDYLRTVRLADDTVTVRALLTHTGGVETPAELFADAVPGLAETLGPVLAVREPGTFRHSNGGYAAVGQLIADVIGTSYEESVAGMVLRPLGMTASSYPSVWPAEDGRAVTGHRLTSEGIFVAARRQVCTLPAAAGLWTTAADLVRFATGWSSLLPASLAREAVTPQAPAVGTQWAHTGLGWLLTPDGDQAGHQGTGPGSAASLIIKPGGGSACVALTNRRVPIQPVAVRAIHHLTT